MNATTSPRNRGPYYIASYTENQSRPLYAEDIGILACCYVCAYLSFRPEIIALRALIYYLCLGSRLACALNRAAVLRALGRSCVHPAERSMHLDKWIN